MAWQLNTSPATWSAADELRSKSLLLETASVVVPATFSWTVEADRVRVLGSYGAGAMEQWVQRPMDQACCGFCYAVATSSALADRYAIQSYEPHGAACPLSAAGLAACVSAAVPATFHQCNGGSVDHALGGFMETAGVPCAGGTAACPAATLPGCPA
jgi:hypothetical protein